MSKHHLLRVSCSVVFIVMTIFLGLLSCEAQEPIRLHFPAEAPLNKRMCHGDLVFLKLHFKPGEELWFIVDTGAPKTLLDKSLEPRLGKILGTKKIKASFYPDVVGHVYAAPQLYWNDVPLVTANRVTATDLSYMGYPFHPVSGVLGMDCLRHYCLQLDFPAGKIRLLDPDKSGGDDLGKSFHLAFHNGFYFGTVFTRADCFGFRGTVFAVDTGCSPDCFLVPKLFRQAFDEQKSIGNRSSKTADVLRFLEQHVVTFNFPKRTMFLKPVVP
ncbi:MAG TPA: hypothetical protein VN761_07410 [Candidatus Polarisedimenticolia bacterium]|nr:hypothetical protein [Candidatus Polarisedimenticolia bacterium]